MNLSDLEQLGAYHNAGHVDIYYEGKHTRLGSVDTFGEMTLNDEGRVFTSRVLAARYSEILTHNEPVVDLAPAAAPAVELPVLNSVVEPLADNGEAALDALLKA